MSFVLYFCTLNNINYALGVSVLRITELYVGFTYWERHATLLPLRDAGVVTVLCALFGSLGLLFLTAGVAFIMLFVGNPMKSC
jgi:hypothetical protein